MRPAPFADGGPAVTPFQPASRLKAVSVSPIMALSAKAAQLRAQGQDVIDLTVGEPDFDTPEHIRAAAMRAMQAGKTRYTPLAGAPELRSAIAERTSRRHGLAITPEQTIACTGAKQVIHNALAATLEPGEQVILPAPFWTSYADMVLLEGGQPVLAPGRWDDRRGWRLDARAIEAAITPATRWILINSPGNPGGSILDAQERQALASVLERHPHVWLMSDDIYEDIAYAGAPVTLAAEHPELAERTLIVNGVSKAYAMTGWRLGWGVGPKPLIQAMTAVQSQTTSAPSSISQAAAVEALTGPQDSVSAMCHAFRERRDAIAPALGRLDGWICPAPDGAFYLFPSIHGLLGSRTPSGMVIETDQALSDYLLQDALVTTVPGSVFGTPGHLRLSFAAAMDRLIQACERIEASTGKLVRAQV